MVNINNMPTKFNTSATSVFAIFGYGVPRDMRRDENYGRYLALVFNAVFDAVQKHRDARPVIVFSGGSTDCAPPFKRTEAEVMRRAFKKLMGRTSVANACRGWRLIVERQSISTLENLLHLRTTLQEHRLRYGRITIFCEYTRRYRLRVLAPKIFSGHVIRVVPIDFDQSANRYRPLNFLRHKERAELRHSLWALQSQLHLRKHHLLFQHKLDYLRKNRGRGHDQAIYDWWAEQLKKFRA